MHLQNTLIFISNDNLTHRAFANANSTLFDTDCYPMPPEDFYVKTFINVQCNYFEIKGSRIPRVDAGSDCNGTKIDSIERIDLKT